MSLDKQCVDKGDILDKHSIMHKLVVSEVSNGGDGKARGGRDLRRACGYGGNSSFLAIVVNQFILRRVGRSQHE